MKKSSQSKNASLIPSSSSSISTPSFRSVEEKAEMTRGIDSSISFNATQDMQITAVYREDHSLWMIAVLVSAVSMIVFGLYKKNESVRWMIEEYKEKLLKVVSLALSTKSNKKAAKK